MRRPVHSPVTAIWASLGIAAAAAGCGNGSTPEGDVAAVPDTFRIEFATSAGSFEVEFVREWSPLAVERVHELGRMGFWSGGKFYRVNERYAQFGYSGRPELDGRWIDAGLPDEPTQASNIRGTVSFARGGPETRSIILFVNRSDNTDLDDLQWNGVLGFPPVGRVVRGMEVIDALHDGYGEEPLQWEDSIAALGNAFLAREYPRLDSILEVSVSVPGR
jgi:peptidyl-prolyl cis-trans isomerase A (cyclophilin A)